MRLGCSLRSRRSRTNVPPTTPPPRTNAVPSALASGRLDAARIPQATIQLASTLRILGELDESERLLRAELARVTAAPDEHALPDQTRAFLALTLIAKGEPVEAAAHALLALAPHVTRYRRSIVGNAEELLAP
jgi:hypothetical protein